MESAGQAPRKGSWTSAAGLELLSLSRISSSSGKHQLCSQSFHLIDSGPYGESRAISLPESQLIMDCYHICKTQRSV